MTHEQSTGAQTVQPVDLCKIFSVPVLCNEMKAPHSSPTNLRPASTSKNQTFCNVSSSPSLTSVGLLVSSESSLSVHFLHKLTEESQ